MVCSVLHTVEDNSKNEKRTKIVIAITVIMMVAEIVAGLMFGSMALLGDGIHMGTHTLALLITVIAYSISRKNALNANFTFGTGKVGVLGGYTSAITLLIAAGFMVYESIHRLISPVDIDFSESIVVAIIGLIVNVISAFLLNESHDHGHDHHHHHGHDHGHDHHHGHDHNLRAAYLHVIADALTSVLAIVALLAGKYVNAIWLDPVVGIVGALVIVKWGIGLLKSTGTILLDYDKCDDLRAEISDIVTASSGTVEDIHIWKVASNKRVLLCSVSGIKEKEKSELQNRLEQMSTFCHSTVSFVPAS